MDAEAFAEKQSNAAPLEKMIKDAWRENLIPGVTIQIFAVVLVLSYYLVPPVNAFWNQLSLYKQDSSLLFAAVSTAIFGGLIPLVHRLITGKAERQKLWGKFLFVTLFWAWKGSEVELFYRFQAWMFGDQCTFSTILIKVIVDQFVYNPLWAAHTVLIGLAWQQHDFSFKATYNGLRHNYFTEKYASIQISTWMVWIPAVSIIYCLPQSLQIPLFNLVLCFFVLLASSLKKD